MHPYVYWVIDTQPGVDPFVHWLTILDAINLASKRAKGSIQTSDGGDLLLGRDVFYLVSRLPGWIGSRDPSDLYFDPECAGMTKLAVGSLMGRYRAHADLSVLPDAFIVQVPGAGSCCGRTMSRALATAALQGKDPGVFGVIDA